MFTRANDEFPPNHPNIDAVKRCQAPNDRSEGHKAGKRDMRRKRVGDRRHHATHPHDTARGHAESNEALPSFYHGASLPRVVSPDGATHCFSLCTSHLPSGGRDGLKHNAIHCAHGSQGQQQFVDELTVQCLHAADVMNACTPLTVIAVALPLHPTRYGPHPGVGPCRSMCKLWRSWRRSFRRAIDMVDAGNRSRRGARHALPGGRCQPCFATFESN